MQRSVSATNAVPYAEQPSERHGSANADVETSEFECTYAPTSSIQATYILNATIPEMPATCLPVRRDVKAKQLTHATQTPCGASTGARATEHTAINTDAALLRRHDSIAARHLDNWMACLRREIHEQIHYSRSFLAASTHTMIKTRDHALKPRWAATSDKLRC